MYIHVYIYKTRIMVGIESTSIPFTMWFCFDRLYFSCFRGASFSDNGLRREQKKSDGSRMPFLIQWQCKFRTLVKRGLLIHVLFISDD